MGRMVAQDGQPVLCPFISKASQKEACSDACAMLCCAVGLNPEIPFRYVCAQSCRGLSVKRFQPLMMAKEGEAKLKAKEGEWTI